MEVSVAPGAPYPNLDRLGGTASRPERANFEARVRGRNWPEVRLQKRSPLVLDIPHDRHISHARAGAGSKVSPHRLTSLVPSQRVKSRYFYTRNNYFVLHAGMQTLYGSDSPRPPLQKSVGERLPIRHWAPMLSTGNYFPYGVLDDTYGDRSVA